MSLDSAKDLIVAKFHGNERRKNLFQKFEEVFQQYLVSGLVAEMWVDGSVITTKEAPSDIDTTVIISPEVGAMLTDHQDRLIAQTNDGEFGPDVDAFAFVELNKSDQNYLDELINPTRTWNEKYRLR